MGRTASTISLLSALLLCSALTAQNGAGVEGTVVDSVTALGISGVSVHFRSEAGEYGAVTDLSGHFRISGMADGQYGSHFEKAGYVPQDSASQGSPLKIVRVGAGQDAPQIRIELVPYAKLSGRVLDSEGQPAAKVNVTYAPGEGQMTDDQGRFTFTDVAPGSYQLYAVPDEHARAGATKDEDRTEIQPTWYPAAMERNLAEAIMVPAGRDLIGYEIRLRSSPVYRVRGVVPGEDGKPVAGAFVGNASETDKVTTFIMPPPKPAQAGPLGFFVLSRRSEPAGGSAMSGRDGRFEFQSVARGPRQFTALAAGRGEGGRPRAQIAIASAVVNHDIDDLEVRMTSPVTIDGMFELAGTAPDRTPAPVRHAVFVVDGDGMAVPVGSTDGNRFHRENVPACSEARIAAPPGLAGGYYLDSISAGERDIAWKAFSLEAGFPPIRIVYKPNAGVVKGTVESPDGASVILIPREDLDGLDVQYGRVSPRSANGTFEIDSVGPGSYYVYAVKQPEPEKLSNAAAIRKIVNSATVVQVAEGTTVTVGVNVVHFDE